MEEVKKRSKEAIQQSTIRANFSETKMKRDPGKQE
jgi:hypothetical protein